MFRVAFVATSTEPGSVAPNVPNSRGPLYFPDKSGPMNQYWGPANIWASPHAYRPIFFSYDGMNTEWRGAGSAHTGGGAQFCMADGPVRWISHNINTGTPWDYEARNGNLWGALNNINQHPDAMPLGNSSF